MSAVPRPKIYIVRDSNVDGVLFNWVSVWTEKPSRMRCEEGAIWRRGQGLEGYVESLWIEDAVKRYRTMPDDDRQMIVLDAK